MPFPFLALLAQLLIGLAFEVVGYLIMPKVKTDKGQDVTDMDDPTAEGGRPIPVVFGELNVDGLNIIWFGDKATTNRKVKA
jgi:hypothetical protein